jgi:LysM repeat protein
VAHFGVWVALVLWAWCLLAFVLSALGHLASLLRLGGPSSAVLRMRNRVVPASVRLILDAVFVAALVAPSVKPTASIASLPARPVAAEVVPPAGPPTAGIHARRARLLAETTQASPAQTYTVRQGDTLSGIAEQDTGSASAWPALVQANRQISNPNLIHPGQILDVPPAWTTAATGAPVASASEPGTHLVAEHESLWGIAAAILGPGASDHDVGVFSMQIFQANHGSVVGPYGERLERPRFIEAGWTLVLPPVSGLRSAPASPALAPAPPAGPGPVIVPVPDAPSPAPDAGTPGLPSTTVPVPTAVPNPVAAVPEIAAAPTAASQPTSDPTSAAAVPTPALHSAGEHPAGQAPAAKGDGLPVHLPEGMVIAGSLAAAIAALAVRARARRRRDEHLDTRPPARLVDGPVLSAIGEANITPSLDRLGPLAVAVLESWAAGHGDQAPRMLACWEQGAQSAFLLGPELATLSPEAR